MTVIDKNIANGVRCREVVADLRSLWEGNYVTGLLGVPYLWGGNYSKDQDYLGLDCSGLVIYILHILGVIPERWDCTARDMVLERSKGDWRAKMHIDLLFDRRFEGKDQLVQDSRKYNAPFGFIKSVPRLYDPSKLEFLFYAKQVEGGVRKISHVAVRYNSCLIIEAGGGNQDCKGPFGLQTARRMGACVRMRPLNYRASGVVARGVLDVA